MMYGPSAEQQAHQQAISLIHGFLAQNRELGPLVTRAALMIAAGYSAEEPKVTILEAIRARDDSDALCAALTGPYGQLALAALEWQFPGWRPALGLLVSAAQLYCQERDRAATAKALWTVAIVGIAGLVLGALGGKARA